MNKLAISCAILSMAGMMACSGNKSQQGADTDSSAPEAVEAVTDTPAVADTEPAAEEAPAEEENTNEADIQLIKDFYKKCVFGGSISKSAIQKYCTSSCMKKLAAANEYDDGGYAVWKFRTEGQDGDGPSKVNNVEPQGDGWYRVSYSDMGAKGVTDVQIVDGKINNYRRVR